MLRVPEERVAGKGAVGGADVDDDSWFNLAAICWTLFMAGRLLCSGVSLVNKGAGGDADADGVSFGTPSVLDTLVGREAWGGAGNLLRGVRGVYG